MEQQKNNLRNLQSTLKKLGYDVKSLEADISRLETKPEKNQEAMALAIRMQTTIVEALSDKVTKENSPKAKGTIK
jgi:predicted  nucleic acid-binding Zn-ribbon protein